MHKYRRLIPLVVAGALLGGVALTLAAGAPHVEITVTARGMAFNVDDEPSPNPPLLLESGRHVQLTFVNEDRGVLHDLTLDGLDLATDLLLGDGSRQTLTFRAPKRALSASYSCSQHLAMMTAALEVR